MLTWKTDTIHVAQTPDGRVYTIRELPKPLVRDGRPYLAVCSRTDKTDRVWEFQVGTFATCTAAKAACEADAKHPAE